MRPFIQVAGIPAERTPIVKDAFLNTLVAQEAFLRKLAYKNTTIKTDASFFDDSDMKHDYYLVVVYDAISNTPLLSSRYYFDTPFIAKCLQGDNASKTVLVHKGKEFDLEGYDMGRIFLADRLSGNIGSSIYRYYRTHIFSLYYSEIVAANKNCSLLLMVREEKYNKQLAKYLRMGFDTIGTALHKGKQHHIILRDLNNA